MHICVYLNRALVPDSVRRDLIRPCRSCSRAWAESLPMGRSRPHVNGALGSLPIERHSKTRDETLILCTVQACFRMLSLGCPAVGSGRGMPDFGTSQSHACLQVLLTCLGYIPGIIHALYIIVSVLSTPPSPVACSLPHPKACMLSTARAEESWLLL